MQAWLSAVVQQALLHELFAREHLHRCAARTGRSRGLRGHCTPARLSRRLGGHFGGQNANSCLMPSLPSLPALYLLHVLTPAHTLLPCCCPSTHPPQVDAEFDVSGKASEAARAAAEAARKVNEAAEDADSKFQFRRKSRILWSDLKRSAPLVRAGDWAGRRSCLRGLCMHRREVWAREATLGCHAAAGGCGCALQPRCCPPQPPLPAVGPPRTRLL